MAVWPAAARFCRCSMTLMMTAPMPAVAMKRALLARTKSRLRQRGCAAPEALACL